MLSRRLLFVSAGLGALAIRLGWGITPVRADENFEVTHTDAEWRKLLTDDQYEVLRQEGTEAPFTSPLLHEE